tara:strand:- start:58 stop:246 length:189 start_codon:yes stop_codon:yes gene_type:complete
MTNLQKLQSLKKLVKEMTTEQIEVRSLLAGLEFKTINKNDYENLSLNASFRVVLNEEYKNRI